jgi:hypothetical protein
LNRLFSKDSVKEQLSREEEEGKEKGTPRGRQEHSKSNCMNDKTKEIREARTIVAMIWQCNCSQV